MSISLQRYADELREYRGQAVHWGRADIDGAPLLGPAPFAMKEEEADERLANEIAAEVSVFNLDDPDQREAFRVLSEQCMNGLKKCAEGTPRWVEERDPVTGKVSMKVYVLAGMPYVTDRSPTNVRAQMPLQLREGTNGNEQSKAG